MTAIKVLHIQDFPDVTLVSKDDRLLGGTSLHHALIRSIFVKLFLKNPPSKTVIARDLTAVSEAR